MVDHPGADPIGPGVLVQMDSKQLSLGNGKVAYEFGALDCFTRKRVVCLAPLNTISGAGPAPGSQGIPFPGGGYPVGWGQ